MPSPPFITKPIYSPQWEGVIMMMCIQLDMSHLYSFLNFNVNRFGILVGATNLDVLLFSPVVVCNFKVFAQKVKNIFGGF